MNWSQIPEKIPLLLVIMSHREWDGGKDRMGKKSRGSQTSVTVSSLIHVVGSYSIYCIIDVLNL